MHVFYEASESGLHIQTESKVDRPTALPMGLLSGTLDE